MARRPLVAVRGRFWRVHAPRWAFSPLSGEGARLGGGRFNPLGMPALYLSADLVTAIDEYGQEIGLRPGTFCAYGVNVEGVADLAAPATRKAWSVSLRDMACPWQRIWTIDHREPPSWSIARRLSAAGASGIKVPSFRRRGGINLVLWRWNDAPNRRVQVIDELSDLPADQSSWQSRGR